MNREDWIAILVCVPFALLFGFVLAAWFDMV